MDKYPCQSKPRDQWCDGGEPGGFMGHTCHLAARSPLTRDEKLILLIEECGEVIQAATKCLRFGFDHDEPGYGLNSLILSKEIGDILGVVRALPLDRWGCDAAKATRLDEASGRRNLHAAVMP